MPRKRMIDPSIWEDLTIGQLSREARLCFIGMLSYADDEGRVQVDPRYIKRAVFGFDDDLNAADVAGILDELRRSVTNLHFYEVEGKKMAVFTNWRRYQYIQKPQPSTLPGPPGETQSATSTLPVSYPSGKANDSGNGPVRLNRIEVNRKEVNRTEPARAGARDAGPAAGGSDTNGETDGITGDAEISPEMMVYIKQARAQRLAERGKP